MHSVFLVSIGIMFGVILGGIIVVIVDLSRMPLIPDDSDEPF